MNRRVLAVLAAAGVAMSLASVTSAQAEPPKPAQPAPAQTGDGESLGSLFHEGANGNKDAFDRAMKLADERLAANPNDAEAMVFHASGLGMRCGEAFQRGDPVEGMRLWNESNQGMSRAVELAPENVTVRMVRGKSLLEGSRYDPNPETSRASLLTALTDLQTAVDLMGKDIDKRMPANARALLYGWLASGHERAGNKDEAKKYAKKAEELGFADEKFKPMIAEGNTSLIALDQALALLPGEPGDSLKDGISRGIRGGHEQSEIVLAKLDKMLEEKPGDATLMSWRGFTRAVSSGRLFAEGNWQQGLKEFGTGVEEMNKAATAEPGNRHALVLRSISLTDRARHEQTPKGREETAALAVTDIERFLRAVQDAGETLTPAQNAAAKAVLGEACLLKGDTAKAKAALTEALAAAEKEPAKKRLAALLKKAE